MILLDIVERNPTPEPWAEGEKIPWNEPGFSSRMLAEHLSQAHDAASRRFKIVDRQVAWIHGTVLDGEKVPVLDLGCGPGFYTSRLARLGHPCKGIDFGPASIAYARAEAMREGLDCTYELADIRDADYGEGYGLAMLIFGEFNVFKPEDARMILRKAHAALAPGGTLLLEPHTFAAVEASGEEAESWYASPAGLFSSQRHIVLTENFWDAGLAVATNRYYVVDAATGTVTRHAASMQAYTDQGYRDLIAECGFVRFRHYPSLTGEVAPDGYGLVALLAEKPA
jgi:SAM-dependent methyltransferase